MLIGILQCGHFPSSDGFPDRTYTDLYTNLLAGRGLTFQTWSVVDMEFPTRINDAEGWLITGSKHGAYEDLPFIAPLETFIRDAYAANIPQVGICFGHQIIAQALGGTVEKFSGGWSVGRTEYDFEGTQLALNAWHQDQVTQVPPGAAVIASAPYCPVAALSYDFPAMSVQFHPEYPPDYVSDFLRRSRGNVLSNGLTDDAVAQLDASDVEADLFAQQAGDFFRAALSQST